MDYILEGFQEALKLIIGFDREVYRIIGFSILISMFSTLVSIILGIPIGLISGLKDFHFKKAYSRIIYTMMGLPPVVVGLLVALLLSRRGPLGHLEMMYTPTAMIIAQTVLVTPIIIGNIFNHTKEHGKMIYEVSKTMGANPWQRLFFLINELRVALFIAMASGFGRAVSEVGAIMIVGGNIKGHTRVMTTYIAMNNSMGNYGSSIAMGIVLLIISFVLNALMYKYIEGDAI
ncbi:ABC transporter permease [Marinisporobacter balticus]|uniref:Tungstate transport system permease protein n=1 Tax=Marinisporobacter balticus TaxID=2018667 RepID=A0A4R2KSQ5_9FIRM|nr:ABC transporter permease [Marinisporobacter balticus]TCO77401.1 tungstate transport system permease protein [Marinisporobacter balticus]